MIRLSYDQFEFESPDTEESLDLAFARLPEFSGLPTFLAACRSGMPPAINTISFLEISRADTIVVHLKKFARLAFSHHEAWQAAILVDEWNELEVGIVVGSQFIWYRWNTTA